MRILDSRGREIEVYNSDRNEVWMNLISGTVRIFIDADDPNAWDKLCRFIAEPPDWNLRLEEDS